MKAILEFNLDEVDDRMEHRYALKGRDLNFAIQEFDQRVMRSLTKYGLNKEIFEHDLDPKLDIKFEELTEREKQVAEQLAQAIRSKLNEAIYEYLTEG